MSDSESNLNAGFQGKSLISSEGNDSQYAEFFDRFGIKSERLDYTGNLGVFPNLVEQEAQTFALYYTSN